jgi:hypothetical protein
MKTRNYLIAGASVVAAIFVRTAGAQTTVVQTPEPSDQTTVVQTEPSPPAVVYSNSYTDVNDFYRSHEFSIDVFAAGSLGEQTIDHISGDRVNRNGRLGLGAGANIFFTKYVGIGGDAYSENTTGPFIDYGNGYLILRFPIPNTGIAPYAFGGGGYQWDPVSQPLAEGGGGVEFRFTPNTGIFVDARYVFADKTDNFGLGRVGFRFSF